MHEAAAFHRQAALFGREGRITLRTVLGKFFCTSATLASGIPLGREGPSVQVGAGIASVLGRLLSLRTEQVKKLIPVGAASAIAAAFNTPLAAVLFALGRDRGRSSRASDGRGGTGLGDCLDGSARVSRQASTLQSSTVSTDPSSRVCGLRGARRSRRCGFGGVQSKVLQIRADFQQSIIE